MIFLDRLLLIHLHLPDLPARPGHDVDPSDGGVNVGQAGRLYDQLSIARDGHTGLRVFDLERETE